MPGPLQGLTSPGGAQKSPIRLLIAAAGQPSAGSKFSPVLRLAEPLCRPQPRTRRRTLRCRPRPRRPGKNQPKAAGSGRTLIVPRATGTSGVRSWPGRVRWCPRRRAPSQHPRPPHEVGDDLGGEWRPPARTASGGCSRKSPLFGAAGADSRPDREAGGITSIVGTISPSATSCLSRHGQPLRRLPARRPCRTRGRVARLSRHLPSSVATRGQVRLP